MDYWMIKITKSGSSSFNKMLPPQAIRMSTAKQLEKRKAHLTLKQVRKICRTERVEVPFTFAFLRNPWDRAVSAWFYSKRKHKDCSLVKWLKRHPQVHANLYQTQCSFIYAGIKTVDFLGRFENFEQDARKVLDRIGYPDLSLLHCNVTTDRQPYQEYYTPEAKDLVAKR
jgi:hypothetical protein